MNPLTWYQNRQQNRLNGQLWRALIEEPARTASDGLRWDEPAIRKALDEGANPNAPAPEEAMVFMELLAQKGWRPLHRAVQAGNVAMAAVLLERGADPTLPSEQGETPAMFAAARWDGALAVRLLDAELARTGRIAPEALASIAQSMADAAAEQRQPWLDSCARYGAIAQADDLDGAMAQAPRKARPRL